jgi:hypothetical protein
MRNDSEREMEVQTLRSQIIEQKRSPSAEFYCENVRKKQFTTLVLCSELSTLPHGYWEKEKHLDEER